MGKIVTVFNQKGGVGKTTTVVNLATALAKKNRKILVCDIDPQANLTSGFGIDLNKDFKSIYDGLINNEEIYNCLIKVNNHIDLIPSNIDLAGGEVELTKFKERENRLKVWLSQLKNNYDYIFIDCPPSLGLLSINALTATDSVLIPIQCEYFALEGVAQLIYTISLVKQSMNANLYIEGILLTMADQRTNLSTSVEDDVRKHFKNLVYQVKIPRNVKLAEAPSYGKSIFDYAKMSKGALAYKSFAKEFELNQ